MNTEIVITKHTYRILKYIYRRKEVSLGKLQKKFKKASVSDFLYLVDCYYACYKDENAFWTHKTDHTTATGIIALTPPGEKYVEDKRLASKQWLLTTLIAFISMLISFLALLVSFCQC